MRIIYFILILFSVALNAEAGCQLMNSVGQIEPFKSDPLSQVLSRLPECPLNVQNFKSALSQAQMPTQPYMVANRGINNAKFGSFSFFEEVKNLPSGEFFFGHFTGVANGQVIADQEPSRGKLMIELIAWDQSKNLFNFYELIGTGRSSQWFYRGDSEDVINDNSFLYLRPEAQMPSSKLRCSACHSSGGPIMKELAAPHNDWWTTQRPLKFALNVPSSEITQWLGQVGDASGLSKSVKAGMARLDLSPAYQAAKKKLSLQAQLRPLFCETEVNLESDLNPLEFSAATVQIPAASLVSPVLSNNVKLSIDKNSYLALLSAYGMHFPETLNQDADHAWLVPVKGLADLNAIASLVRNGTVSQNFVAAVLATDIENPIFSSTRCGLLKLIPASGLANFTDILHSSNLAGAQELYENLTQPERTVAFQMQAAQAVLERAQLQLQSSEGQKLFFEKLLRQRQAVFDSEISQNPRGQIFEPGFRVIFPVR